MVLLTSILIKGKNENSTGHSLSASIGFFASNLMLHIFEKNLSNLETERFHPFIMKNNL